MGCHTWRRVTVKYAGILSSSSPPCVHELHFNNSMSLHNGTWLKLTAILSLHHIIFTIRIWETARLRIWIPETLLQSYFHCLGCLAYPYWYSDTWSIIVMYWYDCVSFRKTSDTDESGKHKPEIENQPARWQDTKTIRIPLKLMYMATAPFFLPIIPPRPPTACLSTFISVQS